MAWACGLERQGAGRIGLLTVFDGVKRRHEAEDAELYNEDQTFKLRLNQALPAENREPGGRWVGESTVSG